MRSLIVPASVIEFWSLYVIKSDSVVASYVNLQGVFNPKIDMISWLLAGLVEHRFQDSVSDSHVKSMSSVPSMRFRFLVQVLPLVQK